MRRRTNPVRRAFTLLELLVVIFIIALLVGILLPAMVNVRRSGRSLKCVQQQRNVFWEFKDFVDDARWQKIGNPALPGAQLFRIDDFQQSLYGVGPYWEFDETTVATVADKGQYLMCPEAATPLQRRSGTFTEGAVFPQFNVTIAFNMRLHRATVQVNGVPVLRPQFVSSRLLDYPDIPLVIDVDGRAAVDAFRSPFFIAPATANPDHFSNNLFWYPSMRHLGRTNVSLTDGSVQSSRSPASEPGWRWRYQPQP